MALDFLAGREWWMGRLLKTLALVLLMFISFSTGAGARLNNIAKEKHELINPELYTGEGGGYCYVTGFQRKAPQFPGTLLEAPLDLPYSGEDVQYYAAEKMYRRFEGEIYYFILLDTTISAKEEAFKDYQQVLTGFIIE